MKVVIIPVPAKAPDGVKLLEYSVDGKKENVYKKPLRCPINGLLAETLKKDEEIKVIYIYIDSNWKCEKNKENFMTELNEINAGIGAKITYDGVPTSFNPTKKTYNELILKLADKIPKNADILADITYGYKTETLSLFCALRFVEEYCDATVRDVIYGQVEFGGMNEFKQQTRFDVTSLYYLFNLMGTMGTDDPETAKKILLDFFAM
jgi:hypothetical protein